MTTSLKLQSVQSFGTVDGPGIRTVFFVQGCPFACSYCHNPETWDFHAGTSYPITEIIKMIEDYRPYYGSDGGITISGGELLFQSDGVAALIDACKDRNIHVVLDTSGMLGNVPIEERLKIKSTVFKNADLVLLDLKFSNEEKYRKYTTGSLSDVLETLELLNSLKKEVWIRQVIVQGINDRREDLMELKTLCSAYPCIKKIELLPFRRLCIEKYEKLGIPFPFANMPETPRTLVAELQRELDSLL